MYIKKIRIKSGLRCLQFDSENAELCVCVCNRFCEYHVVLTLNSDIYKSHHSHRFSLEQSTNVSWASQALSSTKYILVIFFIILFYKHFDEI